MSNQQISKKTLNSIMNEENRVVIFDELGSDIVSGIEWSTTPNIDEFNDLFRVLGAFQISEKSYDSSGIELMQVIKRNSDQRLFGFSFYRSFRDNETIAFSNGEDHGFEYEIPKSHNWGIDYLPNPYVFLPVQEFSITGYGYRHI